VERERNIISERRESNEKEVLKGSGRLHVRRVDWKRRQIKKGGGKQTKWEGIIPYQKEDKSDRGTARGMK